MAKKRIFSFRKIIIPWHCSTTFYTIILILSAMVVLFGARGIIVATNHTRFNSFYPFPLTLSVLAGILFLTSLVRLIIRIIRLFVKDTY
ncbi:MAG: hypothetical protein V1753_03005 [Pseudomonadota bacterium]